MSGTLVRVGRWALLLGVALAFGLGFGVGQLSAQETTGGDVFIQQVPVAQAPPHQPEQPEHPGWEPGNLPSPPCVKNPVFSCPEEPFLPGTGGGEGDHLARVAQYGSSNAATVVQTGGHHWMWGQMEGVGLELTTTQAGSHNTIGGDNPLQDPLMLKGKGHSLDINQYGAHLTYRDNFRFQGSNLSGAVLQAGTNLEINHVGVATQDFQIKQIGTNYTITVQGSQGFPGFPPTP